MSVQADHLEESHCHYYLAENGREREAEFQRQVQDREEQISHLKDRLKILSQKLAESKDKDFKFPRDPRDREKVLLTQKEDGVELQNILKQVCFCIFWIPFLHKNTIHYMYVYTI